MGKDILQLKKAHPTQLSDLMFTDFERKINQTLIQRCKHACKKGKNKSFWALFSHRRCLTAHYAMVDPCYFPGKDKPPVLAEDKIEGEDATLPHRFCRICCFTLVGPVIAAVRRALFPPSPSLPC